MYAALPPVPSTSESARPTAADPAPVPRPSRSLEVETDRIIDSALRRFLKRYVVLGASQILRLMQQHPLPDNSPTGPPSKTALRALSSASAEPILPAQRPEAEPESNTTSRSTGTDGVGSCALCLVLCDRAALSPRGALSPLLPPLLQLSTLRRVPVVPVAQLELHLPNALRSTHCTFIGFKVQYNRVKFTFTERFTVQFTKLFNVS